MLEKHFAEGWFKLWITIDHSRAKHLSSAPILLLDNEIKWLTVNDDCL